jgi:beta-galactosidase
VLSSVKGMGFDIIETYMPWSVHEVSPGEFDFGALDPARDLPGFLSECRAAGVRVLARPGPHINAEMTYFGYPERLFADGELLARCADGTAVVLPSPPRMFPLPCYHHPRFKAQVAGYFDALSRALGGADALYPEGPIIGIQVDNECAKFLRTNPFDWDYSEHAVRLYREWLEKKRGSLAAINEAYGNDCPAMQLVDPPRRMSASTPGELLRMLDWTEFGEHYINESLRWIAALLRERFSAQVPLFHNYPVTLPLPPLDLAGAEEFLDFQGIDAYPQKTAYYDLRAGVKYVSAMSRLPVMVEFSSGSVYYALPLTLDDQIFTTRSILMHGIKGVNFYMIVERERWYGSPVRRDGTTRPRHYAFFKDLLAKVREWGLEEMTPERPVLLLIQREYERLANACTLLSPFSRLAGQFAALFGAPADFLQSEEKHGLSEPVGAAYIRALSFWYWALTAAGVHFAMADTAASAETLAGYGMVIVPTFEFMDSGVQERLQAYAGGGGTLVVGPRAPSLDESMAPRLVLASHMRAPQETRKGVDIFGVPVEELMMFPPDEGQRPSMTYATRVGAGRLVHLGLVTRSMCSVADALPFAPMIDTLARAAGVEPAFVPADARVDTALWRGERGLILFAANPCDVAIDTVVSHAGGVDLEDLESGERFAAGETFEIALEPYTVRTLGALR